LVLEGELGIGKTTVLEWGRRLAVRRDLWVLGSDPVEAEFPLEFAGLADLLQDLPSAVLEALPSPQRHALRVAVLRLEAPESPLDARTIATTALNVLRALAVSRPVVVVVDDLPWLDLPSARVLSFAFRRTRNAPIGLLAASRTGLAGEPAIVPALDGLDQARVERVRLGPLTDEALRVVLADLRLDGPGFRGLLDGCGGNPLFALELAARSQAAVSKDRPGSLGVAPSKRGAPPGAASRPCIVTCPTLSKRSSVSATLTLRAACSTRSRPDHSNWAGAGVWPRLDAAAACSTPPPETWAPPPTRSKPPRTSTGSCPYPSSTPAPSSLWAESTDEPEERPSPTVA
jgi:hypothetical protein